MRKHEPHTFSPLKLPALPFLVFFISLRIVPCRGSSQTYTREHSVLLHLYRHWHAPPSLTHWTTSNKSHCEWAEIECRRDHSIKGLVLFNQSISGPVPPFLSRLRRLQEIDFSYNCFSGGFPPVLCDLSRLRFLDLTRNNFSGPIPGDINRMPRLIAFYLGNNNFSGDIPASIGSLSRLENLSLSENPFSGAAFPSEIGNLSKLVFLEVSSVGFAPSILPSGLVRLTNLVYLNFAQSNLIGEIPDAIGNLTKLEHLDLSMNRLTGTIPRSLFSVESLGTLLLYCNQLSGEIPSPVRSLDLKEVDLSMNRLTGKIPEDFGKLAKLRHLMLYMNGLSGFIPAGIGRSPELKDFLVFTNNLSGSLPLDFGRRSPLETFQVADNRLTGKLPGFLCAAGRLIGVVVFHNEFSGALPESMGNCSTVTVFMAYGNRFSGEVPDGLWSPSSNLRTLMISDNSFTGSLPERLARDLSRLEISNNRFSGRIPEVFPSQKNLVVFKVSNNLLTGSIPINLTALPLLWSLRLDGNRLRGEFPSEIISWESLTSLNVSRNELSGSIPAKIGALPHLTYLDLSENRLSGEIPESMGEQRLAILNLSSNNLRGKIPSGFENPVYETAFLNNPALCATNPSLNLRSCSSDSKTQKSGGPSSPFTARKLGIAAAVVAPALLLAVFAFGILCRAKRGVGVPPEWRLTAFQRLNFTAADVVSSVNDDDVIGGGASGKVYRAAVNRSGDQLVAVKRISAGREFEAEVETLSTVRHKNVVKLLCCVSGDFLKLLVFEYAANRSLDIWLRRKGATALDWPRRLRVAVGAAQGLCYLHHHCSPPVIHRDVKSSNILLDSEFNAKIADFGLARMLKKPGDHHRVPAIEGSFGYIPPDYAQTGRVDEKVDVYGFGVVLLELTTGREAAEGGEQSSLLVDWAWRHAQQGRPIPEALEEEISEGYDVQGMSTVFKLGLQCTRAAPSARPSMAEVLKVLLQCGRLLGGVWGEAAGPP